MPRCFKHMARVRVQVVAYCSVASETAGRAFGGLREALEKELVN